MGWITPENLGTTPARLTLYPNGTEEYNTYQINTAGKLQASTKEGLNYYIECRQRKGWDSCLPAAGMLIWKVNFSSSLWTSNAPNNTANDPHYTLVIPSGTKIGSSYGSKNVWPYSTYNSWEGVSGKPLKEITKSGNNIKLLYIDEPVDPNIYVTWMVNGDTLESVGYKADGSESLRLPTKDIVPCDDSSAIIGWTKEVNWADPFALPADFFQEAAGKVTEEVTYHAVLQEVVLP